MANEDNLKPFKKGYDSRRGHKPKGSKHVSTWIQELLNDESFTMTVDGKRYRGAPMKAIIRAQIALALQGNPRAFDALAKHGWGKIEPTPVIHDNPVVFINNVPIGTRSDEEPNEA